MAGSHVAHAAYKGPSVLKEILIGITLGIAVEVCGRCTIGKTRREPRNSMICLRKMRSVLCVRVEKFPFLGLAMVITDKFLRVSGARLEPVDDESALLHLSI
ncbi:hypothetical protein HAX54_049644 [Datura stramonium]|uniref:Uncharacterized protein n=1 Tax=Datura stramonium TaxID=4076 RepID=A0ABS8SX29_DATST|nr:hypothetical protein [Datura stramonium]